MNLEDLTVIDLAGIGKYERAMLRERIRVYLRVSDRSGAERGSSERSEENGTREQRGPNEERETPNPTR